MNNRIKPKAPAMVLREINANQMELKEQAMYLAFQRGVATSQHYYILIDIGNLLMLAGSSDESRQYALDYVKREVQPVVDSIRERFKRTGKIGASGPELVAIRKLIDWNIAFWKRQPGELLALTLAEYQRRVDGWKVEGVAA